MGDIFSGCDFLAGWTGGVMGLMVGHPLDTIKVRQQILPAGSSILSIAKATYKVEGIAGFFRGMSYPLLGSGIYNALFFGVYGNTLRCLQGFSGSEVRKMCCEGAPPSPTWHRDVFIAGCIGGIMTVLYSCPLEIIKIKLQAQTDVSSTFSPKLTGPLMPTALHQMVQISIPGAVKVDARLSLQVIKPRKEYFKVEKTHRKLCKWNEMTIYNGPFDAMVKIYTRYGIIGGLYKGTWTMMLRDVPTYGLYTLSYEHILCWFKAKDDRSPHTSIASQLVAGGIAGVLSWVTVAPFDVVKSRIQADDFGRPIYRGMMDCFRKTLHQDGVKALFLGVSLATIRSFPANATTFVGYEFVINLCEKCGYCKINKHSEGNKKRQRTEKSS